MDPVELLLRLLLAHFISDFVLQWKGMNESKVRLGLRSPLFWLHIFFTGAVVLVLLPGWSFWYIAVIITVTHFLIDWWKLSYGSDNLFYFSADQLMHIMVLAGSWYYLTAYSNNLLISDVMADLLSTTVLAYLVGFIIVIWPASFFIQCATSRWSETMNTGDDEGLRQAGRWIGTLERILVLMFVLVQQYQAIGFLIAAKSILRFGGRAQSRGEEPGTSRRKETEYVLVGTLLSFTIAIAVGLMILKLTGKL